LWAVAALIIAVAAPAMAGPADWEAAATKAAALLGDTPAPAVDLAAALAAGTDDANYWLAVGLTLKSGADEDYWLPVLINGQAADGSWGSALGSAGAVIGLAAANAKAYASQIAAGADALAAAQNADGSWVGDARDAYVLEALKAALAGGGGGTEDYPIVSISSPALGACINTGFGPQATAPTPAAVAGAGVDLGLHNYSVTFMIPDAAAVTKTIAASPTGAVRAGNVVTITTTTAHALMAGDSVTVSGVTPVGPATNIATAARASNVVTITTAAAHGLAAGNSVVVAGVTPVGTTTFDGTWAVATVPTATSFTFAQVAPADTAVGATGTLSTTFNGSFSVASAPTPTTFTYSQNARNDTGGPGSCARTIESGAGLPAAITIAALGTQKVNLSAIPTTAGALSRKIYRTRTSAAATTPVSLTINASPGGAVRGGPPVAIAVGPGGAVRGAPAVAVTSAVRGGNPAAPVAINTAARVAGVVTIDTTPNPHGLLAGNIVVVSGVVSVGGTNFNNGNAVVPGLTPNPVTFTVASVPTANTFTYNQAAITGTAVSFTDDTGAGGTCYLKNLVTITTAAPHGLLAGNSVALSGVAGAYSKAITAASRSSNKVTITAAGHGLLPGDTVVVSNLTSVGSIVASSALRAWNVVLVTTGAAHGYVAGQSVVVAGLGAAATSFNNGGTNPPTWTIASVPTTTTFTFAQPGPNEAPAAGAGTVKTTFNNDTRTPVFTVLGGADIPTATTFKYSQTAKNDTAGVGAAPTVTTTFNNSFATPTFIVATVPTANTFTFTQAGPYDTAGAAGTCNVKNLVTISTGAAHGLLAGNSVVVQGVAPTAPIVAIATAARVSNVVTITTVGAHGLLPRPSPAPSDWPSGQIVVVLGVAPAGATSFNNGGANPITWTVASVPTANTFTFSQTAADDTGAGGTVGTTFNSAPGAVFSVAAVPTATTFTYAQVAPDDTGGGGTCNLKNLVTITTATAHSLAPGDSVNVQGVTSVGGTDFNGTFGVASSFSSTTFTYAQTADNDTGGFGTVARGSPDLRYKLVKEIPDNATTTYTDILADAQLGANAPAAGFMTVTATATDPGAAATTAVRGGPVVAIALVAVPGAARVSGLVTITTSTPHGLVAGQGVFVTGVTPVGATNFNNDKTNTLNPPTWTVASVYSTTQFTYLQAAGNDTGGGGTCSLVNVVTVTTPLAHGLAAGSMATLSGMYSAWNAPIAASPAGASRTANVVTISTAPTAHGLAVGENVVVAGVVLSVGGTTNFNGTWTITAVPNATSFQYAQNAVDDTGGGGYCSTNFNGSFTVASAPTTTTYTYAQLQRNDSASTGLYGDINRMTVVFDSTTLGDWTFANCGAKTVNVQANVFGLPDGAHTVSATAYDAAGLWGVFLTNFQLDSTNPSTVAIGPLAPQATAVNTGQPYPALCIAADDVFREISWMRWFGLFPFSATAHDAGCGIMRVRLYANTVSTGYGPVPPLALTVGGLPKAKFFTDPLPPVGTGLGIPTANLYANYTPIGNFASPAGWVPGCSTFGGITGGYELGVSKYGFDYPWDFSTYLPSGNSAGFAGPTLAPTLDQVVTDGPRTTISSATRGGTAPVAIAASPGGAVRAANVVTITTTAAHGRAIGDSVVLDGVTAVGSTAISAAARAANVVTITTATAHGLAAGNIVTVAGVTGVLLTTFNGTFPVVSVAGNTFTYNQTAPNDTGTVGSTSKLTTSFNGTFTITGVTPPYTFTYLQPSTLATGNDTGGAATGTTATCYGLGAQMAITTAARASNVVTITTAAAHGLAIGQVVSVAGVTAAGATNFNNGAQNPAGWTIVLVPSATKFTYAQVAANDTGAGGSCRLQNNIVTVSTTAAHNLGVNDAITVASVTAAGGTSFNGGFTVASVLSPTCFTYEQTAANDTGSGGNVQPTFAASLAAGTYFYAIAFQGSTGGVPNPTMITSASPIAKLTIPVSPGGARIRIRNLETSPSSLCADRWIYRSRGAPGTSLRSGYLTRLAALGNNRSPVAVAITTAARSGNLVTITTATAHGLWPNGYNTVRVAGVTSTGTANTNFNGFVTVTSVPDATHFTYNQTLASDTGTGGSMNTPSNYLDGTADRVVGWGGSVLAPYVDIDQDLSVLGVPNPPDCAGLTGGPTDTSMRGYAQYTKCSAYATLNALNRFWPSRGRYGPITLRARAEDQAGRFLYSADTPLTIVVPIFADVPITDWAWDQTERIRNFKPGPRYQAVTGGTGAFPAAELPLQRFYTPDGSVTRRDQVVFIMRARGIISTGAPATAWVDVAASDSAYDDINKAFQLGITAGCAYNPGTAQRWFCPDKRVTRAEMVTFLLRSIGQGIDNTGPDEFADVAPGHWAYGMIQRAYRYDAPGDGLRILEGCRVVGGVKYACPDDPVQRRQMAVFLTRAYVVPAVPVGPSDPW
jgi:hypothetical protein